MSLFRKIGSWFDDQLAHILVVLAIASEIGGELWNIHLGKPIELGPGGLGGGLAAILTAAAAYLTVKTVGAPMAARFLLKGRSDV